MLLSRLFAVWVGCAAPFAAASHEFWIEPVTYQVTSGERLQANFKNGEFFEGNTLSFFEHSSVRFDLAAGGSVTAVTPRSGDAPALDIDVPVADGLAVVVHETAPSKLTYREWAKFQKFAAHKDFSSAEADHVAAGWSQVRFREIYTRHAKALVAIGSGQGADKPLGLETEFVALTNPYAANFDYDMKVQVLYGASPRADAQVEVFDRAPDGTVNVTLHRTDNEGIASVPVTPGHEYLFDAVVLRPADGASSEENAIVWETLWAALTFAVPAK